MRILESLLIQLTMGDAIVLYTSPAHLNSMLILANFTAKHHPSISIIILCNAPESAAACVAAVPSITFRRLPNPALPPGFTTDLVERLFEIPPLQNPVLQDVLMEISQKSRIVAFIIDFFCNSAFEVAGILNLPTYYYVSSGGFSSCVLLYLETINDAIPQELGNLNDFVEIPGCPPIHSSELPSGIHFRQSITYRHFLSTAINMRRSKGIITNTFDALEFKAKEALEQDLCTPNAKTPPVYFIGPLIAENETTNIEHPECLKWLDLQPSKSVIFLCFGRWGLFAVEQLKEMATGLENSGHRFLWAARRPPSVDSDLKGILPEGFLERTKDRGFVLESWAPQREILSHNSVAGFVTHCGRSSILESVSIGVPLICWPLYAEQKMNRVFVVEAMKVGIPLEMEAGGFVTAAELEKRIRELLESEKGKEIKERSAELKNATASAVSDDGSSVVDLENFINSCLRLQ